MDPAGLRVQNTQPFQTQAYFSTTPSPAVDREEECRQMENKFAASFRIMQKLILGQYSTIYGIATERARIDGECCIETFNARRSAFLDKPRQLKVRGDLSPQTELLLEKADIPLDAELSLYELLTAIGRTNKTEPALTIEAIGEHALYFLGYQGVSGAFKKWGVELEKTHPEYAGRLEENLERTPNSIIIQYYVNRPQYIPDCSDDDPASSQIANLKDAAIEYIAAKLPSFFDASDTERKMEKFKLKHDVPEDVMNPALEGKSDNEKIVSILCTMGNYQWWLRGFEEIDQHLNKIIASEFFAGKQVDPKRNSPEPVGGLSLEFTDGLKVILRFSFSALPTMKRSSADLIHLPLIEPNSLNAEQLEAYNCHLSQGLIDVVCENRTPVLTDYKAENHYLYVNEWMGFLSDILKGRVFRFPGMLDKITANVVGLAAYELKREAKSTLGVILASYVTKSWKRMMQEDSRIPPHASSAALSLTLAACETLKNQTPPEVLTEMIESMSIYWTDLTEDSSFLGSAARVLKSQAPYPVISTYLSLAAYNSLAENAHSHAHLCAYLNQWGDEKQAAYHPFEKVIQLEMKKEDVSFYLTMPYRPQEMVLRLLEMPLAHEQYRTFFLDLLHGQKIPLDEMQKRPYANTILPDMAAILPMALDHLIFLLKKNQKPHERIGIVNQFCFLLKAKNTPLSSKQTEKMEEIGEIISSLNGDRISDYFLPLLDFFGSCHDPVLNQAVMEIFKKLKPSQLKIALAKALCKGYIGNAVKVFMWTARGRLIDKETQEELFESLCTTMKMLAPEEITSYLDLLAGYVEPFLPLRNSILSNWVSNQYQTAGYHDLARKAWPNGQSGQEMEEMANSRAEKNIVHPSELPPTTRESIKNEAAVILDGKEANRLYKLSLLLNQPSVQKLFVNHPEEWWDLILSPALTDAKDLPLNESAFVYITCMNSLENISPTPKALSLFAENLEMDLQKADLRKQIPLKLKKALSHHQSRLFKALKDNQMARSILDIAHSNLTRLHMREDVVEMLLNAIDTVLSEGPDAQTFKMISELVNDSGIKKTLEGNVNINSVLSKIYPCLALFYADSHFDLAFHYFQKAYSLSTTYDEQLWRNILTVCKKMHKVAEFAWISHRFDSSRKELQECWQENFRELVLAMHQEGEFYDGDLDALCGLIKAPAFPDLLKDHALASFLMEKLLDVKERSPHYSKSLECALHLLWRLPMKKAYAVKFYQLLKTSADIGLKEKAWDALKELGGLNQAEKSECWMNLLIGFKQSKSTKLIEVLERPLQIPLFRLKKNPDALKAYAILYGTIERMWPEIHTRERISKLKTSYSILSKSHSFLFAIHSAERKVIQLAYAQCLSYSSIPTDQSEAIILLMQILQTHFGRGQEIPENSIGQEEALNRGPDEKNKTEPARWEENLLRALHRILFLRPLDHAFFYPFADLLERRPNHEAGYLMISHLMQERSYADLECIGRLLKGLFSTSHQLSAKELFHFKQFCNKINLQNLLDEMTTLTDERLNRIAYQCAALPPIRQFMPVKSVIDIAFKAQHNICKICIKNWTFDLNVISAVLASPS